MVKSALKNKGFTLIEVLIAVAVLGIALFAVLRVINVAIHNNIYLQQKTLAHWVTQDVAAKLQVGLVPVPAPGGQQAGTAIVLGQNFSWQVNATTITSSPMLQVTVRTLDAASQRSLDAMTLYLPVPQVLQ